MLVLTVSDVISQLLSTCSAVPIWETCMSTCLARAHGGPLTLLNSIHLRPYGASELQSDAIYTLPPRPSLMDSCAAALASSSGKTLPANP